MSSAAAVSSGAGSCERSRGEKRRVSGATSAGEGRDHRGGRVVLLPALMEAARLLQYKSQYRRSSGRTAGLRASLRVTCEAYLKLAGASQFKRDSGALRLMRLLIETHVQAQARAMAKSPSRSEPRSMELRSMVQLAELMAREYVAEMKGDGEVLYASPVPVDAFRPVKRLCVGEIAAEDVALRGMLSHVAERSAFTSVPPRDTDSDCSDASLPSVISRSEKCEDDYVEHSDGIVPETEFEDDCDDDDEYDEYDECRADGNNLAQCICNKCFLGDEGGE